MDRVFQARIRLSSIFLLAAVTVAAVYFMWCKNGILMAVALLFMVVVIEMMVKTAYTVKASGMLVIKRGRFSRTVEINLQDIESIERINRFRVFGRTMSKYLLIHVKGGGAVAVMPVNEEGFVKCIEKCRERNMGK